MLPAPLAAQSGARGIHAHLPEAFRMLSNSSYISEVMLSISEKRCIAISGQKLGCKQQDGTGGTIGRIRQRAQETTRKEG